MKKIEEINISSLDGNSTNPYGATEIPYGDIQMLAEKINELIQVINSINRNDGCGGGGDGVLSREECGVAMQYMTRGQDSTGNSGNFSNSSI